MANYTVDVELAVKAAQAERKLKDVDKLVKSIDTRAQSVSARLSKILIPQQVTASYVKVEDKLKRIRVLQERTNNLLDSRTKRLRGETSITSSLVALEKKRKELLLEQSRASQSQRGALAAQSREVQNQKKLKQLLNEGLKIRQSYAREAKKAADQTAREAKAAADVTRKTQQASGKRRSAALTAGAFPLLFGGGAFQALGGAIGGGLTGNMFGGTTVALQVVGGAVDALAQKAVALGTALNSSTADIDAVVESLGAVASPTENAINRLRELEGEQVALAEATELLANAVGDEGVTALTGFGDAATQFSNQLTIFTTSVLAEAARLLQGSLGFFKDRLEEQNLLRQAQKSTSPEMVLLQTQLSKAFPHQRFELENQIIELQRAQNEEARKNVQLRAESARQGNNNIAILHAENNILKLNSGLTNEQVVREKERILQLQQGNEQQKIYADYASDAINLTQMREKIAENEREHENKRQSLANSVAKALEAQSKAKDRLTAKTYRQNEREQKAADREQKAIDRANKALDKINLTYTDRLALQTASTELEAELLKIDQDREGVLRSINELREKGDPTKAGAAEAAARAFFTAQGSGIFGDLGNIADMPSFASSIEMSNSLLLTQEEQIQKLIEKYPLLGQAADAAANMMTFGIQSFVDGTKTAEEVFADFLRSIADMLMRTAQQMIAQYIVLGVARVFGLGATPSFRQGVDAGLPSFGDYGGLNPDANFGGFVPKKALGGSVSGGRPYLVGERGPELFVPGAQGNIVSNNAMGASNIVVNVDASGSNAQGNGQNAKQLGAAIGAAVQAELIKQQRPGGLLAR